jgi:Cys-rich repeat protein
MYASVLLVLASGCDRVSLVLSPTSGELVAPRSDAGDGSMDDPSGGPDCTESSDCPSHRPHCDITTRRCVQCMSTAHCDTDEVCDLVAQRCTLPCTSSDDCRREDEPRCDTARGLCVECRDDSHCDFRSAPFCRSESGRCVECLSAAHCGSEQPLCDLSRYRCEQCLGDADCGSGQRCDTSENWCVSMQ